MVGIVAGALGAGIGKAAGRASDIAQGYIDDGRKLDLQTELTKLDEEKQLRIDEIKRMRDRNDIVPNAMAKAEAAPIIAQGDAVAAPIKAEGDAKAQVVKTNTPGYLDSVKSDARAKYIESSGSIAAANLANFDLDSKRTITNLQKELSNTTDPTLRSQITQKIRDLTPNSRGGLADVASVGNGYRMLAKELRKDAESADPSERDEMLQRARQYEEMAASSFNSVTERRGGPTSNTGGSKPSAARPSGSSGPWDNYINLQPK